MLVLEDKGDNAVVTADLCFVLDTVSTTVFGGGWSFPSSLLAVSVLLNFVGVFSVSPFAPFLVFAGLDFFGAGGAAASKSLSDVPSYPLEQSSPSSPLRGW